MSSVNSSAKISWYSFSTDWSLFLLASDKHDSERSGKIGAEEFWASLRGFGSSLNVAEHSGNVGQSKLIWYARAFTVFRLINFGNLLVFTRRIGTADFRTVPMVSKTQTRSDISSRDGVRDSTKSCFLWYWLVLILANVTHLKLVSWYTSWKKHWFLKVNESCYWEE